MHFKEYKYQLKKLRPQGLNLLNLCSFALISISDSKLRKNCQVWCCYCFQIKSFHVPFRPHVEQLYLRKLIDENEHELISTCAGIEISQDADNVDQKVKWFPKVHKTYKLLWEAYF